MIYVLLAGVLGAITIATVVLLFRRLRYLDRQLTAICAERDSEWLLHGISRAPNETTSEADGGEWAVNGDEGIPPPPLPGLIRSKRGLHLLRGGLTAAALLAWTREVWRSHRAQLIAATSAAATAGAAITLFTLTPWQADDDRQTPSLPTAQPTSVQPTLKPPTPAPASPTAPPSASPSPTPSKPPASTPTTAAAMLPDDIAGLTDSGSPEPAPGRTRRRTAPPGQDGTPPGRTHTPGPPGQTHTPGPPTTPPGQTETPAPPSGRGLCLGATLPPLADVDACLGGGQPRKA